MSPVAPFLAPERDEAVKRGRPKGGGTTYYTTPTDGSQFPTTLTLTINTDAYTPIWIESPVVIDQVAGEVVTPEAADNMRFGLYRADRDLQPIGAPILDSGDISTASGAVVTYSPGTPLYLARGRYLQVVNTSAAAVVVRAWRGIVGAALTTLSSTPITQLTVGRTYAAFPTPGTAWTGVASSATGGYLLPYLFRVTQP